MKNTKNKNMKIGWIVGITIFVAFSILSFPFIKSSIQSQHSEKVIKEYKAYLKTLEPENEKKLEKKLWVVSYYVDEFDEPTKDSYLKYGIVGGTYSNTSTQDSDLKVIFLISDSSHISIQLYKYGLNPVKSSSKEKYQVLIQDKDGKRFKLIATNYSNRLSFNKTSSKQVHDILMKGGLIKFRIHKIDRPSSKYKFNIPKAKWYGYENAYKELSITI